MILLIFSMEIMPSSRAATQAVRYRPMLVGEVRMKGASYMVESYVYTIGGACVATLQGAHDTVDVNALPAGAYFYRGVDAEGNNVVCKFVK